MASGDSQVFSVLKVLVTVAVLVTSHSVAPTWASLAGAEDAGATLATVSFPELLPPTRVRRIHRYAVRFPVPRPYPVEKLVPYAVPHPIPVPVDAPFQVPVQHPIQYGVPHPVPIPVPHDIPIPVPHAVPVSVNHPYPVPIRRPEPYPVKHLIPYGVPRPFPVPHPVPVAVSNEAYQVGGQLGNSLEQNPGVSGFGGDIAPTGPGQLFQSVPVGGVVPQIQPTVQGYPVDQTPGVTGAGQQTVQYTTGGVLLAVQQQPAVIPQSQQQVVAVSAGADTSQQQDSNIPLQYALVSLIQQQLTAMQSSNLSSSDVAPEEQGVTQLPVQPGGEEQTSSPPVFSDEPATYNASSNEELPASESPVVQLQLVAVGTPQYQPVAVPEYQHILQPAAPIPAPPLLSNNSADNVGPLAALNVSYYTLPLANSSSVEFSQQSDPHIPHPQDPTPPDHENQVQQGPDEYHQLLLSSFGDYNQQKGVPPETSSEAVTVAASETTPAADEGVRSTTGEIHDPTLVHENLIADLQQRIFLSKHQQIAPQLNFSQDQRSGIEFFQKAQDQDKLYQKQLNALQDTFSTYKQQLEQKFIEQSLQQNNQGISQHYQSEFPFFPLSTKLDGEQSTTVKDTVDQVATTTSVLLPTITTEPQSQPPVEAVAGSTSAAPPDVVTTITTSAPPSATPLSTSAPEVIITPETAAPAVAVSPTPTTEVASTSSSADVSTPTSATSPGEASSVPVVVVQAATTPTTSATSTQTSTLVDPTSELSTGASTTTENAVSSTSEQSVQTREAAKQQIFAPVRFRQPVIDTVPTQVVPAQSQLGTIETSQQDSNVFPQGGQHTVGLAVLVPYQQQSVPVHQEPQHQPVFTHYYQTQPQQFLPPFPGDGGHHWQIPV